MREGGLLAAGTGGRNGVGSATLDVRQASLLLIALSAPCEPCEAPAEALRYDWSIEGNVIRLRSRHFFWDRPEEVPERILQPWLKRAGRFRSVGDLWARLRGAKPVDLKAVIKKVK